MAAALRTRGYKAETSESASAHDHTSLTIEIPKDGFTDEALENLKKIISSKETLIKKMLGVNDLPFDDMLRFKVSKDSLCFPWFVLSGADGEVNAYTRFLRAICDMAKKQKRVTATERDIGNDKFAMRLFLVRLGFVGPEYRAARRILLRNLSGNSSWKSGQRPVKPSENTKAGAVSE